MNMTNLRHLQDRGPFEGPRPVVAAIVAVALLAPGFATGPPWLASAALAGPGSGTVDVLPAGPATAGASGTWVFNYQVTEPFARPGGGLITVTIPPGWSDPNLGALIMPGYLEVATNNPGIIDSMTVQGRVVTIHVGAVPGPEAEIGNWVILVYGAQAPPGAARAQEAAPAVAEFTVASAPDVAQAPAPLIAGSPTLDIVAAPAAQLVWQPDDWSLRAGEPRAVQLRTVDAFGNPSAPGVDQLLSLTSSSASFRFLRESVEIQELVIPADSTAVTIEVLDTATGGPVNVRATDGDGVVPLLATGLASATTGPGNAAAFVVSGIADPLIAGQSSLVIVEVLDAYGQRVTDYAGTVHFTATDPGATLPADYVFQPADQGQHYFPAAVSLITAGEQEVAVTEVGGGGASGRQTDITVVGDVAVALAVSGIPDPVVAGASATVTVEALDAYGNRAAGYLGTVGFVASDPHAAVVVPPEYTFTPADQGMHVFPAGIVLASAGLQDVWAFDTVQGTIAGGQLDIDVTAGVAVAGVLSPAGPLPVTVGAAQVATLTVRDTFGNPVADEIATIAITDPPDGTLAVDPGNPHGSQGSPSAQSGRTAVDGTFTVLYEAPGEAGRIDSLGAWSSSVPAASIALVGITTTAGGATQLVWSPAGALVDTAGAPISIVVDARDSFGNIDPLSTALIRLGADTPSARFSVDGGVSWSVGPADSLVLVAGSSGARLLVRDSVAGTPDLHAADAGGFLAAADFSDLTITPAPPGGVLPTAAMPDTLTADGQSELVLTAGPLTDAYGNLIVGGLVTVEAIPGAVASPDEDPAPGVQRRTGIDGRLTCNVRAPGYAVTGLVRLTSLTGSAFGAVVVEYVEPLRFAVESIDPAAAASGDTVQLELGVRNLGDHGATLAGATRLSFSDAEGDLFETWLAAPTALEPGLLTPVRFIPTRVSPGLAAGHYTPIVELRGTDRFASVVDTLLAAPQAGFAVEALEIVAVLAPSSVSRGQQGVSVDVQVTNRGDTSLVLTDLALDFSAPAYQITQIEPPLGGTIAARASLTLTCTVDVDPLALLGGVTLDAHAAATAGPVAILVSHAITPASWQVVSASSLAAVPGSLGPSAVSAGQMHPTGVMIANGGGAAVVLDPALTRLEIGGGLVTPLRDATLVPGGGTAALRFEDLTVPAGTGAGSYPVTLVLGGSENGAPLGLSLVLADSLRVTTPAAPSVTPGSLAPLAVSLGQYRSFSLDIANHGGAALTFENTSVLDIAGGALTVPLAVAVEVEAGGSATLLFGPVQIEPSLPPGDHLVELDAVVREHGLPGTAQLAVDAQLQVDAPASPAWMANSLAPARVTLDQPGVAFRLVVENGGGAALVIGLPGTTLQVTDGVDSLRVAYAGAPLQLPPDASIELTFPAITVPGELANQDYAPLLRLAVREHEVETVVDVAAPAGELGVESPALLGYVDRSLQPAAVTPGDSVRFSLTVRNDGEAAAALSELTTFRVAGIEAPIDTLASTRQLIGGATGTLVFQSVHLSSATTAGAHAADIGIRGRDWNGAPINGDLALGPEALLVVEDGALRILAAASQAPAVHRVNRGQQFDVALAVANLGQEEIVGVAVTVEGDGIAPVTPVLVGSIAGGDTTSVTIPVAAGDVPGLTTLIARITAGSGAVSGDPAGVAPALDDTLALRIDEPALLDPGLAVAAPPGAVDRVLSTGSLIDVRVSVENLGDAAVTSDGRVRLELPAGFGVLGSDEQSFAAGAPVAFVVTAPLSPSASGSLDSLAAVISHVPDDRNSGSTAALARTRVAQGVEVVEAARLEVAARIAAPESALDGQVLPGQLITIEGRVENLGAAGVTGVAELEIETDPEIALATGEPSRRPIAIGGAVQWQIVAPSTPLAPHGVIVRLAGIPRDENTGEVASVSLPQVSIALTALPAPVIVRAAPLTRTSPQVARGQGVMPVLSFALDRSGEDPSAASVLLEAVKPRVLDGSDTPLDPARAVASIELRRDGRVLGTWTPGGGEGGNAASVRLDSPDTLRAGEERLYVLAMAVASTAPAGVILLELPTSGAFEASAGELGGVINLALDTPLRSATLALYDAPHNYPNPFSPGSEQTRISYMLAQIGDMDIEIFTLFGDRVWSRHLSAGMPGAQVGLNEVPWDGSNGNGDIVRNGVYLCRVRGAGLDVRWNIALVR